MSYIRRVFINRKAYELKIPFQLSILEMAKVLHILSSNTKLLKDGILFTIDNDTEILVLFENDKEKSEFKNSPLFEVV